MSSSTLSTGSSASNLPRLCSNASKDPKSDLFHKEPTCDLLKALYVQMYLILGLNLWQGSSHKSLCLLWAKLGMIWSTILSWYSYLNRSCLQLHRFLLVQVYRLFDHWLLNNLVHLRKFALKLLENIIIEPSEGRSLLVVLLCHKSFVSLSSPQQTVKW